MMKLVTTIAAAWIFSFSAAVAKAQTTIPLTLFMGKIPALHVSVNGHEGFFLFDTGGGTTILGPEFARFSGCTPWGQMTGFRMTGERLDFQRCDAVAFDIAGAHLKTATTAVFEIMKLAPKTAPHLDGSLGLDIFAGQVVTLDVSGRTLTIETPRSLRARIRNAKEVPARLVRDAEGAALSVDAAVPTPKGLAWMELDSGNDGAFEIGNHIAPLLDLQPDRKEPQPISFSLGGVIPVKGTALTGNLIMDGNIGEQFFPLWVVTFDLKTGRIWISPASRTGT
jgi:hypothetical protein